MKRFSLYFLLLLCVFFSRCGEKSGSKEALLRPSDKNATKETVIFYSALYQKLQKGIMLGHQDDLAYGNKWYGEAGRSDVKSVCGDYPAVFGWDISLVETGKTVNGDSIVFKKLVSYIRTVNHLGGLSVLNWIPQNTDIKQILENQPSRQAYLARLDKVAVFLHKLVDEEGKLIPIVLQLFGTSETFFSNENCCSTAEFQQFWSLTVNYLRQTSKVHHVLYAYSVYSGAKDGKLVEYYPGNDYVDIVGIALNLDQENDPTGKIYMQTLKTNLAVVTLFAEKHNKIPVLANTGMKGIKIPDYFSNYLLPIISKQKLSYVMFGKNAWNDEKNYYIPVPGHPASEDFDAFTKNPVILTCSKLR
jgi:mannan endo-1,4-beta-mannosidase